MSTLEDYATFVAIVEKGSLTAAARHAGRSLQAVSRALAQLERDLGVQLVRRTTRRSEPTPAGLAFHARLKTVLADLEGARTEAARNGAELVGSLRVGASVLFATKYVVRVLASFMERHPALEIDLVLSDDYAELVGSGLDLAIRIGPLPDSSLKARRLGMLRRVAFAAPGYLAKHPRPMHPADLRKHACVVRTAAQEPDTWFFTVDGGVHPVAVGGPFRATGAAACNEAVALGLGIGMAPRGKSGISSMQPGWSSS